MFSKNISNKYQISYISKRLLPVLIVFVSLQMFAPMAIAETGIVYDVTAPRWQFAPIASPYFFAWWGAPQPSDSDFVSATPLRYQTIECLMGDVAIDQPWSLSRGVIPFSWSWGTQSSGGNPLNTVDDYEKYMLSLIAAGHIGICIDEWVGTDSANTRNAALAAACGRIKAVYPDFIIVAFTSMESDSLIQCLTDGRVDMAIIESYPYVSGDSDWTPTWAREKLNVAKNAGVSEKCIPAFWIDPTDSTFTQAFFESWIQEWRQYHPQMPGLAPLLATGYGTTDAKNMMNMIQNLIKKYYIDAAPKVQFIQPHDGDVLVVSDSAPLSIKAKADRTDLKKWRLYIDNSLVTDQDVSSASISFNYQLSPGPHTITVQAISNDWLRGASQVQISVAALPQ